nr:ACT domain-containing protein [uncultured Cellulosilyticum sp.]
MKGIITVVGKDKVGIIGKVCTLLSEQEINILDISQTIVQGYFNMMMIVDLTNSKSDFVQVVDALENLGNEIGVSIKLQHEEIFDSMHRI